MSNFATLCAALFAPFTETSGRSDVRPCRCVSEDVIQNSSKKFRLGQVTKDNLRLNFKCATFIKCINHTTWQVFCVTGA